MSIIWNKEIIKPSTPTASSYLGGIGGMLSLPAANFEIKDTTERIEIPLSTKPITGLEIPSVTEAVSKLPTYGIEKSLPLVMAKAAGEEIRQKVGGAKEILPTPTTQKFPRTDYTFSDLGKDLTNLGISWIAKPFFDVGLTGAQLITGKDYGGAKWGFGTGKTFGKEFIGSWPDIYKENIRKGDNPVIAGAKTGLTAIFDLMMLYGIGKEGLPIMRKAVGALPDSLLYKIKTTTIPADDIIQAMGGKEVRLPTGEVKPINPEAQGFISGLTTSERKGLFNAVNSAQKIGNIFEVGVKEPTALGEFAGIKPKEVPVTEPTRQLPGYQYAQPPSIRGALGEPEMVPVGFGKELIKLEPRKVELDYGGRIGKKTLDAVDINLNGEYRGTAIIEPPNVLKYGEIGGVRLRLIDKEGETLIPGLTKEQALNPETWKKYLPEIKLEVKTEIPKELEPLAQKIQNLEVLRNMNPEDEKIANVLGKAKLKYAQAVKGIVSEVKPTIPKEFELLAQEARKYKSAEEFAGIGKINPEETKVVWQGQKGAQVIGNKQIIRKPTLQDFKNDILRLTRKRYYGEGTIEQQYRNMLKKQPNLIVSYIDTGKGWEISKIDNFENIKGGIVYGIDKGWAKVVDDFESPIAKAVRKTFDDEGTLVDFYNKAVKEIVPEVKPIIPTKRPPTLEQLKLKEKPIPPAKIPPTITKSTELPKYPEDSYKKELLQEIEKLPVLPKIESDVLGWRPPTLSYQNPITKKLYQVWDKFNEAFTKRAPDILKTFQSNEIKRLTLEKQRVLDGLTKKYTEEFIKPLEKLSNEEKKKIGQMIFKYIPIETGYEPLIKNIDSHIGQLGKAIVDLDKKLVAEGKLNPEMALLSEETWFKNLGEYMRTLYVRPPESFGELPKIVPHRTFSADGIIDRSSFKRKMTDMEWGLNSLQFEGRSLDEIKDLFNNNPKKVEEIGVEAKKAWGWRTEADFVLARTFKDMTNTYATRLWQEAVVKDPELFSKTFKDGFEPTKKFLPRGVEKDIRLGPINNGYINSNLEDDIRTMMSYGRDTIDKILGEPLSWWKAFKVAGNPATVARNFLSGSLVQTDMAGYPLWNPKNIPSYIESVKDYFTKSPFYKKLRDAGAYGSDYYTVEIEKSLMREIEKSSNPAETLTKRLLEKLGNGIKDVKKLTSYYGHIDHLQRTYLIKVAMKDGATLPQAIHFANKWELDYRFVPKFIEKMRGPIGGWIAPFISFYSLMAPRIIETTSTRPWVLLKYPIIIALLGYLSRQFLGYTKEQAETAKPSFLQNDPYTVLTPFKDENGNPIYINLTYTLPFGGWQTAFIDLPAIGDMVKGMGLVGGIQSVFNNYDSFTQRKIFNDGDLPEDKRKKIATYIMRFVSPGVVPHILNIWDAAKGKVTGWPYPMEKNLTQVILRSVGVSTYTGGYNEAITKIRTYDQEIKDIQTALGSIMRNVNISQEEKQQKVMESRKEIMDRIDKIQKVGKSMPPPPSIKISPKIQSRAGTKEALSLENMTTNLIKRELI